MSTNTYYAVDNIQQALDKRLFPTVTMWNRLEGRPRTDNFNRALRAEIRDALWMITKQWQMGEFIGDDAGSPVVSKILAQTYKLNKYRADEKIVQEFKDEIPLEAMVEQKKLPFTQGEQIISLDIRLMMGRRWLKLIGGMGIARQDFIDAYPFESGDPDDEKNAKIFAHKETWQNFAAFTGRALDGYELYKYITDNAANHSYDKLDPGVMVTATQKTNLEGFETTFVKWFNSFFLQPADDNNDAWMPSHLEYQFYVSGKEDDKEKVYSAKEYYHGHLDWYNLDIDGSMKSLGDTGIPDPKPEEPVFEEFIPTTVSFGGMPNTRWWTFEDGVTNFGNIRPDTTDLNKLLVMEFGLIYANDWFLFPLTLSAGSIGKVKGITVTNVFGERIWIEPAGSGKDDDWQRWSMFTTNIIGNNNEKFDKSILFLPTTRKIQEGAPMEEVKLIRDEVANMVWGIETMVPLAHGTSVKGNEAGIEFKNYLQMLKYESGPVTPPVLLDNEAKIKYQLMNTVPENWIPFIPVHTDATKRQIKLQRASMPRFLKNDEDDPQTVKPRTSLLRQGLDQVTPEKYFIHEEEVPRAGTLVKQSFQRTRWYNGKTFNWLGIHKQTGRGEGSSGLAFDAIIPKET